MARRYFIAGNWKMNNTASKAVELINGINAQIAGETSVDVAVCPTFTALDASSKALAGSNVKLGAQNMYTKASGAYTGEISAEMLKEFNCTYVILGHSERREYFKETDAFINEKVKVVLENGMKPILCVGEKLEEREAGNTIAVVSKQTSEGMAGLSAEDAQKVVIAYEPVWAIGTGKTATPAMAQEVHAEIRKVLAGLFGAEASENIQILYGGSMKPENADDLLKEKDIDGGLIGGAALKADSFVALVKSAAKLA
ncbi:MAG: triose-phosphate isomerase [Opitutales bacterium]|nr:triose-phosphate isomerase [Opitutales bacterium]